tara:strand:+ start:1031 stop:1783 length:753 start_codon:yes stop_codon:yes gene_type:complete
MVTLFLFIGLIAGFFAAFLGIGAGVFLMPVYILLGIPYTIAIQASLMAVFFSSLTNSLQNRVIFQTHFEPIIFMAIPAAISALIGGSVLIHIIHSKTLMIIFCGILLINIDLLKYISKRKIKMKSSKKRYLLTYIFTGIISGLSASLLGIGGGILIVTLLCFFSKFSVRASVNTSIVIMIVTTFFSLLSGILQNPLPYSTGLPSALGAVIGSFFGAFVPPYVKPNLILKINYTISFILAITMIYNIISIG